MKLRGIILAKRYVAMCLMASLSNVNCMTLIIIFFPSMSDRQVLQLFNIIWSLDRTAALRRLELSTLELLATGVHLHSLLSHPNNGQQVRWALLAIRVVSNLQETPASSLQIHPFHKTRHPKKGLWCSRLWMSSRGHQQDFVCEAGTQMGSPWHQKERLGPVSTLHLFFHSS